MLINAIILFIAVLTHQNNMSVTTTVQPATESLSRHGWVVSQFFNFNILKTLYVSDFEKGFLFRFQQFFITEYWKFSKNNVIEFFAKHFFLFYLRMVNIFHKAEWKHDFEHNICVYFFYDIVDLQFKFVHRGKRFRNLICIDLFNRSIFIFI